ncbi:hypothetical protein [Bailinhaonella thermotolerans]|uniref:hypothetical protein n=1 Tax=Bailinhaonella thermotolerans TaxID=1070861 RepID=UPI00192A6AF0|nr:hypothetical protein [Bailinhaonella thermotolerans]
MTENWVAIALIFLGLFLIGGVVSFIRMGIRLFAVVLGLGAVLAIVAGVLRW